MRSLLFAFALGCSSGSGKVDDGTDSDTDKDAETDTDADTDADTDTDITDDWSGAYAGDVQMEVRVWSWLVCAGPASFEVDADGRLGGDINCVNPERGVPFLMTVEAEVQDDGYVEGTTTMLWVFEDESTESFDGALWGQVGEAGIELDLETTVSIEEEPFVTVHGEGLLTR